MIDEARRTVNFSTKTLSFTIAARRACKSPVSKADSRRENGNRTIEPPPLDRKMDFTSHLPMETTGISLNFERISYLLEASSPMCIYISRSQLEFARYFNIHRDVYTIRSSRWDISSYWIMFNFCECSIPVRWLDSNFSTRIQRTYHRESDSSKREI